MEGINGWQQLIDFLSDVGFIGLLIIILASSKMGWWEWKSTIEKREKVAGERLAKCESEVTEWKNMALRGLVVAEQATGKPRQ